MGDNANDNTSSAMDVLVFIGRVLAFAVRYPIPSAVLALIIVALLKDGWGAALLTLVGSTLAFGAWSFAHPRSFRRLVADPVRAGWLYRRSWARLATDHGLAPASPWGRSPVVPKLKRVERSVAADVLHVALAPRQAVSDWEEQAERLAHSLRVRRVRISSDKPGTVLVKVYRRDLLTQPIPLLEPQESTAVPARVRIGMTEDGVPWELPILGRHVLIGGATGAGKGSIIWAVLAALGPAIHVGVVQPWAIDPKGGMELALGESLFARFAYSAQDAANLLRQAASLVVERATRLRGRTRLHTPTSAEPLVVVIIDELAALVAYQSDRKLAAEITRDLELILSQGRALAVSVIGCVQDPAKDTVSFRQLFTDRIGLRLQESTQTDMVLGAEARKAGALCHLIPISQPGVGYVIEDGGTGVQRVRAHHVTDADIKRLVKDYAPQSDPNRAVDPLNKSTW